MNWEEKHANEVFAEWTPEVVFKVYCNDNLSELPLGILVDMKKYIDSIIESK